MSTTQNNSTPWLIAAAVSLAAFMEVLDTTITNVSLSHIAGTLSASQDESTWVLTSYLVANGIILPLSGWLSGVFGRKRYFMLSIALFTLASFACGAANSLGMLIFFRMLQGLAGGGLQPMQQAITLDAFPVDKRAAAFGITSITIIVAPILGPTLGGLITDNYSWRWIFYLNVPVGIFALWMVNRFVTDPPHAAAKLVKSIDYIGLALIVIGLACMQIVLDKGQQDDWFDSNFIVIFFTISFFCLTSAVFWLLRQKDPIVELRMLAQPAFGLSCLMIFFTGFALYSGTALLPLLLQSQFGYDATLSGLVLSPSGLIIIFMMPLVGKLTGKIPAKYLIMTGMALLTFGMWYSAHLAPNLDYKSFVWIRISQVIALPFLFIPISTLAFKDVPKELSNKGAALYALSRNLGGSVGIATIIAFVSRHQQLRQSQLVDHLVGSSANYRALLAKYTQTIHDHGYNLITSSQLAIGRIYREVFHQSSILAYSDAFAFMAIVTAILIGVCFFLPYNNPRQKNTAAAEAAH